jgi:secernin
MSTLEASCDTLVILGPSTRDGHTLFAKNSDRPPTECQPLFQAPHLRHPQGATLHCQYISIPQASETLAVLGSRPWWLWGFEHGVNECRVAIGNEAIHARELPSAVGLLGMDLVRLGLERGRSASEAKNMITDLLERHGQGGSARLGEDVRYHNGFVITDPDEAWVLETFGRHWAARRVGDRAAISNVYSIERDWDEVSQGAEAYARRQGRWSAADRLDFRRAVEDPTVRYRGEARLDASCRFLASGARPSVGSLMRHLRDHYDGGTIHQPGRPDGDPRAWSVCMHPHPGVSATAASMVADLPSDRTIPMGIWCSLATPCTSLFLPVDFTGPLPEPLTHGAGQPASASAWWALKALSDAVMRDPRALTPIVQEVWGSCEAELLEDWRRDRGRVAAPLPGRVERMLAQQRTLLEKLKKHGAGEKPPEPEPSPPS